METTQITATRTTYVTKTGTRRPVVTVTFPDGRQVEVGGTRAGRAQAALVVRYDTPWAVKKGLHVSGLRGDLGKAQAEAQNLLHEVTRRVGRETFVTRYAAVEAHAVPVEDLGETGPGAGQEAPVEAPVYGPHETTEGVLARIDADREAAAEAHRAAQKAVEDFDAATAQDAEEDADVDQMAGLPAPSGAGLVAALEAVWADVQANVPDLPNVVMITGSGRLGRTARWGHYWGARWRESRCEDPKAHPELFIAGERLATGAALTLQTILHEAAHALAEVRGIKDTSRGGQYHNGAFLRLAEELGLTYPEESPSLIGYSGVVLAEGTADRYAATIAALDEAITVALPEFEGLEAGGREGGGDKAPVAPRPPKAGGRSNDRLICSCPTPRIIRASRTVAEEAPILCGLCRDEFHREEG